MKLAAAAARSSSAMPARTSSGSGIDSAFDGPTQSIARWMGPLLFVVVEVESLPPDDALAPPLEREPPLLLLEPPEDEPPVAPPGGSPREPLPRSWRIAAKRARWMSPGAPE